MARGFMLIELIVTVAIVAVIAMLAAPVSELAVKRGKEQELSAALRQLREALDAYKLAADEGRIPKEAGGNGYPKSLELLASGVNDLRAPQGGRKLYFLRRIPRDPMADPELLPAATWGRRSYASSPEAPKDGADVFDVYSLSKDTGLNGVPYREW